MRGQLVDTLTELRIRVREELRLDALVRAATRTARRRRSGTPRRSTSRRSRGPRRSDAAARCAPPGHRIRRPTPCGAGGPTGRVTSSNVTPPSVDFHSADGCAPAYTTPGWPAGAGWICQTRSREASASAGKPIEPSGGSAQVAPRSSEWKTAGPQCSLVPPRTAGPRGHRHRGCRCPRRTRPASRTPAPVRRAATPRGQHSGRSRDPSWSRSAVRPRTSSSSSFSVAAPATTLINGSPDA